MHWRISILADLETGTDEDTEAIWHPDRHGNAVEYGSAQDAAHALASILDMSLYNEQHVIEFVIRKFED